MKKIFMFLLSFLFINIASQVHSYDATKYAICYGETNDFLGNLLNRQRSNIERISKDED